MINPRPLITDLQKAIDEAWNFWRMSPDGSRYHALTRQLGLFVQAVVQHAIKDGKAMLTTPIPNVGKVSISMVVVNGRSIITNLSHVKDFDEVVNDYLMWLCKRYLEKPDTQHVQSPAYIRMGIVMRAYSMERQLNNLRKREMLTTDPSAPIIQSGREGVSTTEATRLLARDAQTDILVSGSQTPNDLRYWSPDYGEVSFSNDIRAAELEDDGFFNRLKVLWFYPYLDFRTTVHLPKSFQGLSLRYVYVALRYNAGFSLSEIAKELDIHSSRLTALKKEYSRLFPNIRSDVWLNLKKDFKPICVEESMLCRMNLKGVHNRYSLLKVIDDKWVRTDILRSKRIFWQLFRLAVDRVKKPDDGQLDNLHIVLRNEDKIPDVKITVKQDRNSLCLMDSCRLAQKNDSAGA